MLARALIAGEEDAVWFDSAVDAEASGAVVEVDESAAAGARDDAERVVDDGAAVRCVVGAD